VARRFLDIAGIDASSFYPTMVSGTPFLEWYCRPDANGAWIILVKSAFGGYTPCATETIVVSLSHLVLWCLICYRIYLIRKDLSIKRFCLQSHYYNYGLALVAAYNTAEPLFRAVMGLSVVNLDGPASLPPFEVRISCVNGFILAVLLKLQ